ncbi:MAG: ABC transporter substrate-binding protein [Spirochaetaceae bacterium]|jgi:raffinose/stachyose/melibiose transport system substrate-binding protein|nr:ABC transporter substrate-binding protein [Spirochaetaceae bacterium]
MKKLSVCLVLAVAVGLVLGCSGAKKTGRNAAGEIEVTIPHYKTGQNVGAVFFLPQIERFNKKYAGTYKIVIEEIVQDMYNEKMMQLGQQKKLPVLLEGGGNQEWYRDFIIPGNMFVDLKPWLDAHPDIKNRLTPENIAYNTTNDGKIFSVGYPVVRPIGIYYNTTLYQPSKSFAETTWDAVLAELGSNKIALMTGENAFSTQLVLSSLIASEPGGKEILQAGFVNKITDFNKKPLIDAIAKLQNLFRNYASSNAVGAVYADAANSFMSKNAALIANGSWMMGDFANTNSDKWSNGFNGADVHGSVFPGNIAVGGMGIGYSWWISSNATDDEKQLAYAYLEFILSPEELEQYMLIEGGTTPRMELSDSFLAKRAENRLMEEYIGAVNADTVLCPTWEEAVLPSIASSDFPRLLPLLATGRMTAQEFCAELTDKAAESAF